MKRLTVFAILVGSLCAGSGLSFSQLDLVVTKESAAPTALVLKPAAAEEFVDAESVVKELYDLFLFDLKFSRAFTVLDETNQAAYLNRQDEERNAIDYEDWRRIQVQGKAVNYLIKTKLVPRGPGLLELDLLVYNINEGRREIGTAYGADPPFSIKFLRRAGHRATAEIIKTLTRGAVVPITETRILFVNSVISKRTKELYLIDYDGWEKSLTQVTRFDSVTVFPDWAPNGKEIAYVSYKNNWPDAFIHNLPTGKVSTLARFEGTNTTPRWFPDGNKLAISLSAEGNPEIYSINKDGSDPKRLTFHRMADEAPDVSPTGDQIVFTSDRVGSPQIYIMDVDGANKRRISYIERRCDTPMWSPITIGDDYRIAFTGFYNNMQGDIFTVRPDGSDAKKITDGVSDNQNPSWSPCGQYIALSSNRLGKHEIFLVSSDPERLLPNGQRFYRVTYMPGDNLSPAWEPK